MEKNQQTDKPLFDNLRKLINLIDNFRDVGLHEHIDLPRIAVLGTQSSGKSSLLENIVGMDFLPRGSGVVTRRPLELRMVHASDPTSKPYGVFEQISDKKYFNFDEIRTTIESQTDKIAGKDKGIIDKPIKLTVYSYECPDLTLIDLPGITKIAVGTQEDVEKITTDMAKRYCSEERTIILAVISANADMSTSQGLHLARKWDPDGVRTLGVITKIDIMDRGTDASKMILNKEIHLKLGYVGIKNRSQEDINNKVKVAVALDKEEQFFKNHLVYRNIDKKFLGTRSLTKRLTEVLQKNISRNLKSILKQISEKAQQCESVIKSLGQPMPKDGSEKIHLIWKLLRDFTNQYIASIKGKCKQQVVKVVQKDLELSTGSIIKSMFQDLYEEQSKEDFKITKDITNEEIQRAIKNHQGDSIPGFPSIYSFLFLLTPKLQKLRNPALNLLNDVYTQLRKLSCQLISKVAFKSPAIMEEMINETDRFLMKLKNKTLDHINTTIDCQCTYIFTNNALYLQKRTKLIPSKDANEKKDDKARNEAMGDSKQERDKLKRDAEKLFVIQLRTRVEWYYKIVIKSLRQVIPKSIGFLLVETSQVNMQHQLYNQLLKNQQLIQSLTEPPEITQQRETAKNTLNVLSKARRIIKREVPPEQSKDLDQSRIQ